jgi:hypothetical protein
MGREKSDSRKENMVINATLECWLCHRSYRLRLELLYADTELGTPHYWCRECTGPRTLPRRLKQLITDAKRQATVRNMNADEIAVIQRILARLDESKTPASSLSEWRQYAEFTGDEPLDDMAA